MADAVDLKSSVLADVWVRLPPALLKKRGYIPALFCVLVRVCIKLGYPVWHSQTGYPKEKSGAEVFIRKVVR